MRRPGMVAAGLAALLGLCRGLSPEGIRFVNRARQAGIAARIQCGGPEKKWIPEANGSGVAALDYDNDGRLDLLIVNGASMERLAAVVSGKQPSPSKTGVFLYHNLGQGRFEDVTERAGLMNPYWGTGANAADFDNDGFTDILITNIGVDLLYRNNGNGTFTEIGSRAGLSRNIAWHTGSAFGDYDNDGLPDLYIAGYVDLHALAWTGAAPLCEYRGLPAFCGPLGLKGERDILYHNNGNGTFTDVTERAGVAEKTARYGFSVVFEDFNEDGRPDIFVANDSGANYLYLNTGKGTFVESALESGVAYNADGKSQANMGIAVGDYDNDGHLDLLTTTFSEDYFPLFRRVARGFYQDVSSETGLVAATTPWLGWACGFADLDNDGRRDLWTANGHVYPNAGALGSTTWLQPLAIFENRGGKFQLVGGAVHAIPKNSYRGGCAADFDNDGRMDLAILPIEGEPLLLLNRTENRNAWIGFSLNGTRSNRDALGARIRVEACRQTQIDTVRNGGSYLSRNDPRLHFGLGSCGKADRVTITWPSGRVQVLRDPAVNRYWPIREE